jgi:small-conductance mechanosensitive channel
LPKHLFKIATGFVFAILIVWLSCVFVVHGASNPPSPPQATKFSSLPTAGDVINFLNQNIDWYHQIWQEDQVSADPADVLFVDQDRQNALETLRLAFDFARAAAPLLGPEAATENQSGAVGRYQSLLSAAQAAEDEVKQTQAELDSDRKSLATARGANRKKLQSTVDELQSELALDQERSQTLHQLVQFITGGAGSGGNLAAKIDELERSVPELQASTQNQAKTASSSAAQASSPSQHSVASGAVSLLEDVFSRSHVEGILNRRIRSTNELARASQKLRAPLIAEVTAIAQQGEQAAKAADTSDAAQLEQLKKQIDSLNRKFKQASAVLLPLNKQQVLFDFYNSNLIRWRDVSKTQYAAALRKLLLRLAIFGIVIAVFFILAEMWRRAVFRYVHDYRRRYQFLLLRRIVLWCAIAITVAFALANEIGSIATFAGLITAGIAVALQNVIMAIAGYFFLIGKYGVRVGDRVQISGVTGDVIDIGLVRLHLMELGGTGIERQPTGRVVVFSNAVVFQPTASFFKQIPGTNFVWHEVSLTLAPDSDFSVAEQRVLGAVEKVYADYREQIEEQYREMERNLNITSGPPKPRSQLRVTQSGLEVVVRYPVALQTAMEIDDRVTRELLRSLAQPPRLRLVGTGTPNIQPVAGTDKAA